MNWGKDTDLKARTSTNKHEQARTSTYREFSRKDAKTDITLRRKGAKARRRLNGECSLKCVKRVSMKNHLKGQEVFISRHRRYS